jgi:hypothetical protein
MNSIHPVGDIQHIAEYSYSECHIRVQLSYRSNIPSALCRLIVQAPGAKGVKNFTCVASSVA